jgi:hypothetical protein
LLHYQISRPGAAVLYTAQCVFHEYASRTGETFLDFADPPEKQTSASCPGENHASYAIHMDIAETRDGIHPPIQIVRFDSAPNSDCTVTTGKFRGTVISS